MKFEYKVMTQNWERARGANRRIKVAPEPKTGGPDRIRTGDLVLDRDVC